VLDVEELRIPGVFLIRPAVHGDHRGFFTESYNHRAFEAQGLGFDFVQDNHSLSAQAGTVRGLHFQREPKAQTKLVRVLSGAIYDVAVDIRKGSPTFGQWVSAILSEDNKRQLLVPKGFAHGFCTLVADTQVFYKVDEYYSPEHDSGIAWDDPQIGIEWPVAKAHAVLSGKDAGLAGLASLG